MKIKFLKDHLDNSKGETKEVETQRARYFINVGVAKLVEDEPKKATKKSEPKEDKSLKVNLETK